MPAPAFRFGLLLIAGLYAASFAGRLPDPLGLLSGLTPLALLLFLPRIRPVVLPLAAGALLLWFDARVLIGERLDPGLESRDIEALVRIADFPVTGGATRFVGESLPGAGLPARLRLSWYDPEALPVLGECWRMTLRLRRPRGYSNPGRFDYEAWLMGRRIGATGYVRRAERSDACTPAGVATRLRRVLAERIRATLPGDDATAVLLAVTLGARQWLGDAQWNAFAVTGTSHLMAISGMHVALASGAVFGLLRLVLAAVGVRTNHRDLASAGALVFASLYTVISGLGVPSRRALIMLAVAGFALLSRRQVSAWQCLGIAAFAIVALSPFDALSPGFGLSFGAVALLVALAARRPSAAALSAAARMADAVRQLGLLQVTLLLGLLPLTAGLFGRLSWISPVANLIVLPIFNLVALPAALAGVVVPGAPGEVLLLLAWRATHWILTVVSGLAAAPFANVSLPALDTLASAAAAVAAAVTLMPAGFPVRGVRWIALLFILVRPVERPPVGCADIHVLDVGQGLATVIETASHTIVYDGGPAFRSGGDTGELVVSPFLSWRGIDAVDLLVVSHADLDHAGGIRSIADAVPVEAVLVGEPLGIPTRLPRALPCEAGQLMAADGIRLAVLHPDRDRRREGNNASCVVELRAGRHGALLTGDIERPVERQLLSAGMLGAVDLVVMPHHGSNTSSHAAFVQTLSPSLAVASAGFRNRWGMPRQEVVARWASAGADVLDTGRDGAIGVRLCADTGLDLLYRQRVRSRRFWHDD